MKDFNNVDRYMADNAIFDAIPSYLLLSVLFGGGIRGADQNYVSKCMLEHTSSQGKPDNLKTLTPFAGTFIDPSSDYDIVCSRWSEYITRTTLRCTDVDNCADYLKSCTTDHRCQYRTPVSGAYSVWSSQKIVNESRMEGFE